MQLNTPKKVLITGAMGFIGGTLMKALKAQGVPVVGVDLRSSGDNIFAADVGNVERMGELLQGVDVVVHTAALVTNALDDKQIWRANVQGTATLIAAAKARGVSRFVHISSIVAYGNAAEGELHEEHPVHACGGSYVLTKLAAEHAVLQAHAGGGIEAVILRLGDVYGPGSRPWIVEPLLAIKKNRFFLPDRGRGKFRPVYIDDVVRGIVLAVTIDGVGGEVINLSCKGAVTTAEFFAWHCRWLNKSGPMTISTGLALFLARIAAGLAKVTGKPSELTPATVHQLSTRCWYSIDKAERLLGWTPVTPLERGMAMSNQWATEQGYVV